MKTNILGVQVDNISEQDLLQQIFCFLESKEKHYIVTPNPEIILKAGKDEEFKKILNFADIAIPDGFGVMCAAKFLGKPLQARIAGADLIIKLCKETSGKPYKIFFLGGQKGAGKSAVEKMRNKFPELALAGSFDGRIDGSEEVDRIAISIINHSQAEILLVGLGAPKQEKWIYRNLDKLTNVKAAIGVGGGIDFIAGKMPRAPIWMRRCGLEWLYRFKQEPGKRFFRVINAVLIFPIKVLLFKLKKQE